MADLITYFNFNDVTPLQSDAGQSVSIGGTANNFAVSPGTSQNALFGDPPGQDLTLFAGAGGASNGKWIDITVNTLGLTDIRLSYATLSSAEGFNTQTLSYAVNSGSFTNFGSVSPPTDTFAVRAFDLSAVGAIENQSAVTFRLTFAGASTTNFFENNRLDNILLVGVPEPSVAALAVFGAPALLMRFRPRARQS